MNNVQNSKPSLVQEFLKAIAEEIKSHSDRKGNFTVGAPWGQWRYTTGDHHVYQFRIDEALKDPPDTQVKLFVQENHYWGHLIGARGLTAQVAFDSYLGEEVVRGRLSIESQSLLQKLQNALTSLNSKDHSSNFAESIFSPLDPQGETDKITDFTLAALSSPVQEQKRLFIWGPPGTGKTQALGEIASDLLLRGESVFVTANTHVAVNNGLERLIKCLKEKDPGILASLLKSGSILRYGLLEGPLANMDAQIPLSENQASPSQWMRIRHKSFWERRVALVLAHKAAKDQWEEWRRNNRQKTLRAETFRQKMLESEQELHRNQRKWRNLLQEGVLAAKVVAATLAQVYIRSTFRDRFFDNVIVDEASMAHLPALYLAASLAKKRVIVIGDFRQLPPIALAKTPMAQKWLGRDIFEAIGIDQWVERKTTGHRDLHILRKQRRMRPAISALTNQVFYQGLLLDDEKILDQESAQDPVALQLYNTGAAQPWSTRRGKGEGKSRINLYHACVAVQLAQRSLMKRSEANTQGIGIITPYREQAKLIQYMLEDQGLTEQVQVATVHQFQGEERDIIIWDTVDTEGFPISPLLSGPLGSSGSRMINVALTRARRHLMIIADCQFLVENLSEEASLRKVFSKIIEFQKPGSKNKVALVDSRKVFPATKNFSNLFLKDLANAQRSVVISSSLLYRTLDEKIMARLEALRKEGVKILFDTLRPKHQREVLKDQYKGPPKILYEEGVVTICHDFPNWQNFITPNLVLIDHRVCWFSNKNLLQKERDLTQVEGYRFTGTQAVEDIHTFFSLSLLKDAPQLHINCPLCNGIMVLMWNRRQYGSAGDFYAACAEGCGYNRPLLRGERSQHDGHPIRIASVSRPALTQKSLPGFVPLKPITPVQKKEHVLDVCPQCSSPTAYRYRPQQYLFVGCTTWPQCQFKRNYQEDCSECGGQLVVRRSQRGIFLGCVHYPRCRHTKDLGDVTQKLQLTG